MADNPLPAPSLATGPDPASPVIPGIWRRLAAFTYEGVVLFGVVMLAGLLWGTLTQQRHALEGQWGLRAFLFLVLGLYFSWFWSRGGQTVAMKAWHIRVVDLHGQPITQTRAALRYVLSWMWFVPALGIAYFAGLRSTAEIFGLMTVGVFTYAALARLHPQRQFWHDVIGGTRLITLRPPPRKKAVAARDAGSAPQAASQAPASSTSPSPTNPPPAPYQ